jgi:hypothetical protein
MTAVCCRPVLLMAALRGERAAGPVASMALVEAIAAVVCEPGVHTTDPIILSAMLQVGPLWSDHAVLLSRQTCLLCDNQANSVAVKADCLSAAVYALRLPTAA